MPTTGPTKLENQERRGVAYGLAAFVAWGLTVFYFKAVGHVTPIEIILHRILGSAVMLAVVILIRGRTAEFIQALRDRRTLLTLIFTSALVSSNWFVFVWAVNHDQIMQTSLGYFMLPLVNVLLGFIFLKERLKPLQGLCVLLAATGVGVLWAKTGGVPLVSLYLAFNFSVYSLLRKTAKVDAVIGLSVEISLLAPFALGAALLMEKQGSAVFLHLDHKTNLLLMAAFITTAVPLIWFVNAAQRLKLSTLGLMQYIPPSFTFLIAIFVFHEPFSLAQMISFGFIWTGLIIFTTDSLVTRRNNKLRNKKQTRLAAQATIENGETTQKAKPVTVCPEQILPSLEGVDDGRI